jgi:hypothetical protein
MEAGATSADSSGDDREDTMFDVNAARGIQLLSDQRNADDLRAAGSTAWPN